MFEWASQQDWVYYTKSRFTQTLPKKITGKNKFIFEISVEHSEAIKWKIRVGPFIKLVLHLSAQYNTKSHDKHVFRHSSLSRS